VHRGNKRARARVGVWVNQREEMLNDTQTHTPLIVMSTRWNDHHTYQMFRCLVWGEDACSGMRKAFSRVSANRSRGFIR